MHELYFNTKATDDSEISKLLQYFKHTDIGNKDFGALSDTVDYYKNSEEGLSHVCDEVRKYGDERAEYAKVERMVLMINSIMRKKEHHWKMP